VKSLKNWWKNERQRERNILKKNSKRVRSDSSKCEDTIDSPELLSLGGIDATLTEESRQSSEDEPTLTMAFSDNDEHIL
jgi:hypothetical protein